MTIYERERDKRYDCNIPITCGAFTCFSQAELPK